jgi:hypothetical protein
VNTRRRHIPHLVDVILTAAANDTFAWAQLEEAVFAPNGLLDRFNDIERGIFTGTEEYRKISAAIEEKRLQWMARGSWGIGAGLKIKPS